MNENRLGDYQTSNSAAQAEDNGPALHGSVYQQEASLLKLEKLSQRVTIISVIIPCIIIAIGAFVYLDIQEKVDKTDQSQADKVERVANDLEIKLNALDVRIARATHDLDRKLEDIDTKRQALENQTAKMSASKVDLKTMEKALAQLEKQIKTNANQDKSTLATVERINRQLGNAIEKHNSGMKKNTDEIKEEVRTFKEKTDGKLMELSVYEEQITGITTQVSLLEKKIDTLETETAASFNQKINQLKLDLKARIAVVQKKADAANATAVKAGKTAAAAAAKTSTGQSTQEPKTAPTTDATTDTSANQPAAPPASPVKNSSGISEQTLTQ